MSEVDHQKLFAFVDKMPAFPKSVHRVIQMTSEINTPAREIVQVIENDPVMTIKILKIINSPFYALPQKITSIQRAVVHLGLNTIKNQALSIAAMGVLNEHNKASFNTRDFLLHSLTTASICRILAEKIAIPVADRSQFFVAGLLHDFGKIVFAEFNPQGFKQALEMSLSKNISLHQAELECMGINHPEAGKLLVEKWALDDTLILAIDHHHNNQLQNSCLKDCVFAANQISKRLQFGFSGNPVIESFPSYIIDQFGQSEESLISSLGDVSLIKSEALSLIHL